MVEVAILFRTVIEISLRMSSDAVWHNAIFCQSPPPITLPARAEATRIKPSNKKMIFGMKIWQFLWHPYWLSMDRARPWGPPLGRNATTRGFHNIYQ